MLNSNHPHDERLSALASGDTEATSDASLTAHVNSCDRCTDLVNELGALRASLAALPDLAPPRPLRLLPAVDDEPAPADRLGGWARRFFAPVLTAGAALALVGLVGTAAPAASDGGLFRDVGNQLAAPATVQEFAAQESDGAGDAAGGGEPDTLGATASEPSTALGGEALTDQRTSASAPASPEMEGVPQATAGDSSAAVTAEPTAERSPWPMVLFAGVALMVAAALLRWILVPRSDTPA